MQASLQRLLIRVIDYAGLFPPESLQADQALLEYRRWQAHEFQRALGRFCCPVARLADLLPLLKQEEHLAVAAIGKASGSRDEWNMDREREARLMTDFQVRAGDAAEIEAFEVRIPEKADPTTFIEDLQGFSSADVFAELPWNDQISDAVAAIAEYDWLAVKARTGGIRPGDVPSAEDVAAFIWNCISLEVPFKFTAGLHHPLPNVNLETGDRQHGFLNVLTACTLAYAHETPTNELAKVLGADDPASWSFSADEMTFRGEAISGLDIEATREIVTGFGSCSIQDPYDDMLKLGLLTRTGSKEIGSNTR